VRPKWFDAVPESDHEALLLFWNAADTRLFELSNFHLKPLSTPCTAALRVVEEVVEAFELKGSDTIDMGRGVSTSIFGPNKTETA
jgi:hypothetical protein